MAGTTTDRQLSYIRYSPLRNRSRSRDPVGPLCRPATRSVALAGHHNDEAGRLRWVVLMLACWIMFGNYFAYDNPSALSTLLRGWMAEGKEPPTGLHYYQLNLLYAVYSVPNIVLPLFAGAFVEKHGTGRTLVVLSALVCIGQAVMSVGCQQRSWWTMHLGRFLFGLGGESLAVAQARLVARWFEGHELALAIGLNLSVARLGTVFNNNVSPRIAMRYSVPVAMWAGVATCLVSLACTIGCVLVDGHQGRLPGLRVSNHGPCAPEARFRAHFGFWWLVAVCFLNYSCMVPFNNVASEYLQARFFPGNISTANAYMSLPDSLAIALVPVLGVFVDRCQRKLDVILVGGVSFLVGHHLLGTMERLPWVPLSFLGVGYSSMLAFWPCVPNLVAIDGQATAYGILTSAFNAATSLVPLVVPLVISLDTPHYSWCGPFFASIAAASSILTLAIYAINKRYRLGLNSRSFSVQPVIVMSSAALLSLTAVGKL